MNMQARMSIIIISLMLMGCAESYAKTEYATWLMIWYGRDQAWWNTVNPDATKNLINGKWTTLDWCDNSQIDAYLDSIKAAGVNIVIADLTNGWNWLDQRCQYIQSLCKVKGMKFCVAENSGGNTASFESHSKDIWDKFAGPDAPYSDTYFRYKGKPLIVCYAVRDWYNSYLKSDTEFRSRFNLVWASGEDSNIDKWGWQLEPWKGVIPSKDSMFVTSSVRWNPADGAMWRKSIAWMDYNFALAKANDPDYIIVASFDDPTERNGWLISNTTHCEKGRQIRDRWGMLRPSALYDRVRQWTSGKPSVRSGGVLRDGAYRVSHNKTGKRLIVQDNLKLGRGVPDAFVSVGEASDPPVDLFWLYHIGNNRYRIIALHSGLALEPAENGASVIQNWDDPARNQHWIIKRNTVGFYTINNSVSGRYLSMDDSGVTLKVDNVDAERQWIFTPVITL